ncbi:MAG: metallophosphoesterase [Methanobrevibacter sp.]|nr:metallophosphoesterase [Methanobrevibacter sp.]
MQFIDLKDNTNVFFTSDLHFYHENIIRYCKRPFKTIDEMNQSLIDNWNKTVPKDGIVFILGDFCFGQRTVWNSLLKQLNGKKYLIIGNHDRLSQIDYQSFEMCVDLLSIKIQKTSFVLSHYPFLAWGGSHRGTINLFGHVHSAPNMQPGDNIDFDTIKFWPDNAYDVGVDNNNYTPISYTELINKLQNNGETIG